MANAVYPKYKQALLDADTNVDLIAGDIRAILVDLADYTYSAAHDFLDDVPAAARVAVSGSLTTKSVTDGTFDCDAWTWSTVSGDPSEAIILYNHDGGADTARRLIYFMDTSQTGLPVTPNGGNITYTPHANGVFTL